MRQLVTKPFPYFVGVYSLEELVNVETKVCVINILGSESRKVTPVSHEYSGGNIVAGVQYGRRTTLETKIGDIPVFPSIRDVMREGIKFDTGVIYLPPAAVSQAVSELVNYNPELKRIVIVTEKLSVKDSMSIRFLCQEAGVDVIGANCLGVANVWDNVRVGGALGGDKPEETLKKGTVAIHSNSGNFTTTIAEYLRTGGFGVSSAVSSGKDLYIHFALAEFLFAAQNDPRTKVIALYVEPGGYYEKVAIDWIKDRRFAFNKPIVVCVTGRWKKDLNRSCGHAGAMSGSGDDALSKEEWFDNYFGVSQFDPEKPLVSKLGVRVASIQDFPIAMKAIYEKIDEKPDFESSGNLSLKVWMSDNIVKLPKELDLPTVQAMPPYDKQIREINKHIGAHYIRQSMADKSGASRMDPKTQVAELHGKTILELSNHTIEENIFYSIAKVMPEQQDIPMINILLNMFLKVDAERIDSLEYAKRNGATPNAYLASQVLAIGNNQYITKTKHYSKLIIDLIREYGIDEKTNEYPEELTEIIFKEILTNEKQPETKLGEILLKEIKTSNKKCESLQLCQHILKLAETKGYEIKDKFEFLLATASMMIFWKPMLEKRISRETGEDALAYFYVISNMVAFSVTDRKSNKYWAKLVDMKPGNLTESFTKNTFKILFNREPNEAEITEIKYLLGLTLTNGPGTISAKGAKESVSARNYIPTCFAGFMLNTGLAHGGNGYEAVDYLLNNFDKVNLNDPGKNDAEINIGLLANNAARKYRDYVRNTKEEGKIDYDRIPCVNHPVFKGHDVNIDPREEYVKQQLDKNGIFNVFLEFYHKLVVELFNEGATKNIFCVNVDAVISVIALKLVWSDFKNEKITKAQIQDLVFILFLIGRAIGVSAEIADHKVRGLDMDCRTPQSQLQYVL
jgi:succinyl-CoA synthetase alpha subunit/citrate synthase